jgi:hypothetical protein
MTLKSYCDEKGIYYNPPMENLINKQLKKLKEMEDICWSTFALRSKDKDFSLLEKQFNVMINVRAQIRVLELLLNPEGFEKT